jgi:hypothetical protein
MSRRSRSTTRSTSGPGISIAVLGILTGASVLAACAAADDAGGRKRKSSPRDPGDDFFDDDIPAVEQPLAPVTNEDGGAFGDANRRPASKDAGAKVDAGADAGPAPRTYCEGSLKPGDLAVTELMISSRSGSADDGEWVEITSTQTCWLKLDGVTIESPRGAATSNTATVPGGIELGPRASFIVADSTDAVKNHDLPGVVVAWNASDVLKNDGDSVLVKLGATTIDTTTYPSFTNLEPGRSIAFPDDCAWGQKADWARWSLTFDVWTAGFKGTPNATNADVACY